MAKYICFDTETTGLDSNVNNLLTATFITLDSELNEADRLNIDLQHQNYNVNSIAMGINKIDLVQHHKNATNLIDTRVTLINFLEKNKQDFNLIPIGQNIKHDILFLKTILNNEEYNKYFSYNSIDTISIAHFLKLAGKLPEKQSVKLTNLSDYFGNSLDTDTDKQHTSEYDTEMTIKLLKSFLELVN